MTANPPAPPVLPILFIVALLTIAAIWFGVTRLLPAIHGP